MAPTLHWKVLASKSCDTASNQRLLPVRAHEGPCAAHVNLFLGVCNILR